MLNQFGKKSPWIRMLTQIYPWNSIFHYWLPCSWFGWNDLIEINTKKHIYYQFFVAFDCQKCQRGILTHSQFNHDIKQNICIVKCNYTFPLQSKSESKSESKSKSKSGWGKISL